MLFTRRVSAVAILLSAALIAAGPAAAQAPADDELAGRLARLLSTYEQYGFSGSVLVAKGGRVVFEGGYGLANRETGERNTPETRFDFASIAKTFTGAAVLSLEAEGKLATSDRLEQHLGAFPEDKSAATIQHLATHTAGLAHRSKSELDYGTDREAYVQSMKDAPFESAPGSSYRYTNAGASLLGAVVEEVAGREFEEVVRERLFRPAGLEATGFYPEFTLGAPGLAYGYADETSTAAPPEYDDWTWGAIGATGIVSTVGDIHRWFAALHSGAVLPPEQTAKAFDASAEEAFGWHTQTDEQGRAFIHKGGGLAAMQSQILAYPDEAVVVVWAHNNMSRNWRRALNRGLAAVALGDPYLQPAAVGEARAAGPELSGWWEAQSGTRLQLTADASGLSVGGNGFGLADGPLRPAVNGSWASFDVEGVSSFELSVDDRGVRVRLEPEGSDLALRRDDSGAEAFVPLVEPNETALAFARQASAWILAGETEQIWNVSAYRPVRGAYSQEGWADRGRFIGGRVGTEVRVLEEAWVRREGAWRYWRTFEGSSGVVVVMRLGVSSDGQVLAFGINPRGSEPEFEDKKVVSEPAAAT